MAERQLTPTLNAAIQRAHLNMSTCLAEKIYLWINNVQFYLLPATCILCKKPAFQARDLCQECELRLMPLIRPCHSCGLPLPKTYSTGRLCGTCMVFPPPHRRLVAAYKYCDPISALIATFKYQSKLVNGRVLSELLCSHLMAQYSQEQLPSLIIPVPLHSGRVRKRGFNQAAEIARRLATEMNIPIAENIVSRTKNTAQQTGLNARARSSNIRSAFRVREGFCFKPDTTVAVIDDVVTTGATVAELAHVLLKAKAREVHVWALARTVA